MNRMLIPRILRASTWISIPVFVLCLVAGWFLYDKNPAELPGWLAPIYPSLMSLLTALIFVSFTLMVAGYAFSLTFDAILNGLLRRFGQPATARVIDRYNTGISTGRVSHIWRVKLRVRTDSGEEFEAVTEDQGGGGDVGGDVPVRYDPLTKSVAIMRPWDTPQPKQKHGNF